MSKIMKEIDKEIASKKASPLTSQAKPSPKCVQSTSVPNKRRQTIFEDYSTLIQFVKNKKPSAKQKLYSSDRLKHN